MPRAQFNKKFKIQVVKQRFEEGGDFTWKYINTRNEEDFVYFVWKIVT